MKRMKLVLAAVASLGLAGLTGCTGGVYSEGYYATTAPPEVIVEAHDVAPYAGAVWIDGYWNWTGDRYSWVRGYWSQPRPGYVWTPHRWYRDGRGWRLSSGRWRVVVR
jgi:YXWGXW repeat-containing protein